MEFHLLQTLPILFMALAASLATVVEPEVYPKSMLPNTPIRGIPKAITDSPPNDISSNTNHKGSTSYVMATPEFNSPKYGDAALDEQLMVLEMSKLYILEKELHPGKKVNMHISKDISARPTFIPRQAVDALLHTNNEAFSVNPDSEKAKSWKKSINECENMSNKNEEKYCATSLESMVDYITSKYGKNVKAFSTEVNGEESTTFQEYRIEGVKQLSTNNAIVCHQMYAVHYCHIRSNINPYMVSLVGENNLRAKAISICHGGHDTALWSPGHFAFLVLNVKPGTESICHFLLEGDVTWVRY